MEIKLLKTLFNKDTFDEYCSYVDNDVFSSDYTLSVWKKLSEYYTSNDAPITPKELWSIHKISLSGASNEYKESIYEVYNLINKADAVDGADFYLKELKKDAIIAKAFSLYDSGKTDKFIDLISQLNDLEETRLEEDNFDSDELKEVGKNVGGLEWCHPILTEKMKYYHNESSLLVCARPNTGKTSFLIANAIKFIEQGKKVVYFSISEDTSFKLKQRFIQAAYKVNNDEFFNDIDSLVEKFNKEYKSNLFIYNVSGLHINDVVAVVKKHKPDIVMYDQYQKVEIRHGAKARSDEILTNIVVALKGVAKDYNHSIICGTQAASSAEQNNFSGNKYKKIIGLNDIAGSKTGVAGEFQTILGVGSDAPDKNEFHYFPDNTKVEVSSKWFHIAKSKDEFFGDTFILKLDKDRCQWY